MDTPSSSSSSSWSISNIDIGEKIGRGRFGHVHKVKRKDDSSYYAMKVLFKAELIESGVLTQLLKEVEIQSKMRHKYILRLIGTSQDARRVYLFTELMLNGSFYAILKRLGRFPENVVGKYIRY